MSRQETRIKWNDIYGPIRNLFIFNTANVRVDFWTQTNTINAMRWLWLLLKYCFFYRFGIYLYIDIKTTSHFINGGILYAPKTVIERQTQTELILREHRTKREQTKDVDMDHGCKLYGAVPLRNLCIHPKMNTAWCSKIAVKVNLNSIFIRT